MNNVELEIVDLLQYLKEMRDISLEEMTNNKIQWEEGYATGQHSAYEDAVERCERLIEVDTAVYSESPIQHIQV